MKLDSNKSGGIGFVGLLTVLFIGLKLTNYIDWSWWWVLAPMWITPAIILSVFVFIGAGIGVIGLLDAGIKARRRRRRKL